MRPMKCKNGHFYDADRFTSCPRCKKENGALSSKQNQKVKEEKISKPVGWLVCVGGAEYGTIHALKAGNNKIGAKKGLDIYLQNAKDLSESCQIIISYNVENKKFSVQAGNAKELSYVNGEVILIDKSLQARDKIQIGEECFLFIPLCGDDFSWED